MARKRDYKAEYRARNERAIRAGFKSYAEQRKYRSLAAQDVALSGYTAYDKDKAKTKQAVLVRDQLALAKKILAETQGGLPDELLEKIRRLIPEPDKFYPLMRALYEAG